MADDATINSNLPSDGQRTRPFGWLHVAEISFASIHHRPATVAVFVSIFPNLTKDQAMTFDSPPVKFKPYTRQTISQAPQWQHLPESLREAVQVVSRVMPFRTNQYVMDELIDWGKVPDDPIYRLTFPHQDMLSPADYSKLRDLVLVKKDEAAIEETVRGIRLAMNPHPAGQMTHNVPFMNGQPVSGLQHKYKETVLFFPSAGQTCHAYCTFCFRWPQFVGMDDLKFDARESSELVAYLKLHTEVTDVLITGGDPLIMKTRSLAGYIEPLLAPELSHIQNIRIGTKSVAYWPQRYVSDKDSDDLLRLFEKVVASGKNLAIMGHYNHPAELRTEIAQRAVKRIVSTGATLRMQAPLIRHINEDPNGWVELWTTGVRLGAIPYYMFVERDTGPSHYFELPLAKAYEIFQSAYQQVSGLARTVRGPSMSAFPGKVVIDGIVTIAGEKVFALQFLQARNPDWVRRPFYARFDPTATWLHDLVPAFGEKKFFFETDEDTRHKTVHIMSRHAGRHVPESTVEIPAVTAEA
ncbi:KamA family protein [Paraburkholderia sp. JPY162]|uniref:KamA family protein n=2 Tax=Paraburkholderia youngii TaxID=2782701 RepID=A0A7W8L9K1_9BURK|nr:KamA family protein [Paraburkholderia youngii]